jgi:hypothetical protein
LKRKKNNLPQNLLNFNELLNMLLRNNCVIRREWEVGHLAEKVSHCRIFFVVAVVYLVDVMGPNFVFFVIHIASAFLSLSHTHTHLFPVAVSFLFFGKNEKLLCDPFCYLFNPLPLSFNFNL